MQPSTHTAGAVQRAVDQAKMFHDLISHINPNLRNWLVDPVEPDSDDRPRADEDQDLVHHAGEGRRPVGAGHGLHGRVARRVGWTVAGPRRSAPARRDEDAGGVRRAGPLDDQLLLLRPVHVRRLAEEHLGGLHQRLRQRRVRMDREPRSAAVAPISIASTPSAISSPASVPTMPTPRMRSVSGSMTSLVTPSDAVDRRWRGRRPPTGSARPRPAASLSASASVRPAQAIFGIGEDHRGNRRWLEHDLVAGDHVDRHARLVRGLVRQHRLAGHVADGEDGRVGGAALGVDLDEALWRRPSRWCVSRPAVFEFGRGRRDEHAVEDLGAPAAPRPRTSRDPALGRGHAGDLGREHHLANVFSSAGPAARTRSRSAPGSRPGVISTTVTFVPSAA